MTRPFDVLAIGELNPDLILTDIHAAGPVVGTEQTFETERLTLGSSTAIACVLMQRLGLKTSFAGLIGEDSHGRFCTAALEAEGIDLSGLKRSAEVETGITISISYARDRMLLTRAGAMSVFEASMLDTTLLESTRHVHVGSYFLQKGLRCGLPDLFKAAQAAGCTTSLDTGWDPDEQWDLDELSSVLPFVDVFLPNEDETCALARVDDPIIALDILHAAGAAEIAVKLGGKGGAVSVKGQGVNKAPGFPVDVVDTTGAGDSFNAGYIAARLAGRSVEDRLKLANACGSLTAEALGGTNGFFSADAPFERAGLD